MKNRGFGIVVILIVLVIMAALAIWNWDSVKEVGENLSGRKEKAQEQIENFKDKVKGVEEDLQKRVDTMQPDD